MQATSGDSSDSLIGRRFYDYRIAKKLAQGGMGAVYLLLHESLPNIRKVLKVVLPEYAQDPVIRDRFHREAEAVSQLVHPNIVGIDSVGTLDDGRLCMLIPFLEGQPLHEFFRERGRRLSPTCVMHIAAHVARALDHAHRRGIVHRDLKPANVFITPTDDDPYFAKVLDFGISKQMSPGADRPPATLAGPLGTPYYMAVEQYEHAAEVTPAADIYALAIMIWELVTGRLPWAVQDVRVLYHKQLSDPPDLPVGDALSAAWEAILRSALAPDPRVRPQSMRQFMQALASALPAASPEDPSGVEILQRTAPMLGGERAAAPGDAPVLDPAHHAHDSTWSLEAQLPPDDANRSPDSTWPLQSPRPQGGPPVNARALSQAEPMAEPRATVAGRRRSAPIPVRDEPPSTPLASERADRAAPTATGADEAPIVSSAPVVAAPPGASPTLAMEERSAASSAPGPGAEQIAPLASGPERSMPSSRARPPWPQAVSASRPRTTGGRSPAARWVAAGVALAGVYLLLRPHHGDRLPPPPGTVRFAAATVRPGVFDAARRPQMCALLDGAEDCAASTDPARVAPVRVEAFDLDVLEVTNGEIAAWLSSMDARSTVDSYGRIAMRQGAIPLVLASPDCFGALVATPVGRVVASPDKARWPAVCVTWYGANEYCRAHHKRLPLAVEWELAAKGSEGRPFPWGGDLPTPDGVAFDLRDASEPHPRDVGSSPRDVSPEGVHDLGGNVAEWVEDGHGADTQTIRGGSWGSRGPCHLLGSGCKRIVMTKFSKDVGFRCARSVPARSK